MLNVFVFLFNERIYYPIILIVCMTYSSKNIYYFYFYYPTRCGKKIPLYDAKKISTPDSFFRETTDNSYNSISFCGTSPPNLYFVVTLTNNFFLKTIVTLKVIYEKKNIIHLNKTSSNHSGLYYNQPKQNLLKYFLNEFNHIPYQFH